MADELIIDIKADVSGLQPTVDLLEKLGKVDAATAEQFRKATAEFQKQEKALKGVGSESKKAGETAKKSGKDIADGAKEGSKGLNDLSTSIKGIAGALGIALSLGALKEFISTSINAFAEQELALQRLKASLEDITGEGGNAFATLKTGAEELQKTSIFSDDQIEQVENMLVQLGLTSQQTQQLATRIVDTASRTGRGLEEIANTFILAIEGQTKGLRTLGASFKATGDQVENFNSLLESTSKFSGGAAQALETQAGQAANLKNQINELEEAVGKAAAPLKLFFLESARNILELFAPAVDKAKEGVDKIRATTAAAFKDLPVSEIESNIKSLQKLSDEIVNAFTPGETSDEEAQAQRDRLLSIDAQIAALKELIQIKQQSAQDDLEFGKADRELKGKSIEQLKTEIELLGKRRDANTINVRAAIDAREEQIKKLQELEEKAGKERQRLEKEFADARIRAEEEHFKMSEDGLKRFVAAQKRLIVERGLSEEETEQALTNLQFLELQIRRENYLKYGKGIGEIDNAISDLLIKNSRQVNEEIRKQNQDRFERALKNAKDIQQSIDEAGQAQGDLTKKSFAELFAIIKAGKDAGIKGLEDVEAAQKEVLDRFISIVEQMASIGEQIEGLLNAQLEQRLSELDEIKDKTLEVFDAESEALADKLKKDLITQAQYDNQLRELKKKKEADDKRIEAETKRLKREEAQREKDFGLFSAIVNTAAAATKVLANPFLLALVLAAGALQLAKIVSTPVPKFHSGKLASADSSEQHAIIRRDETVVSPENSKQYRETLTAIHNRKIPASILNNFVRMKLDSMPKASEKSIQFPDMLNEHGVRRAFSKGTRINNASEIAMHIVEALPRDNPRRRI